MSPLNASGNGGSEPGTQKKRSACTEPSEKRPVVKARKVRAGELKGELPVELLLMLLLF
jgi:hypothetical protein